jgi:hypothetical protein
VDAGSITYLILYKIAEAMDASLFAIATGYLGVAFFCFGGALYFWEAIVRKKEESVTDVGRIELDASAAGAAASTAIEKVHEEGEQNTRREQGVFADSKSSCKGKEEEQDAITENEQENETSSKNEDDPDATTTSPESGVYIMIAQREPLDQLKSEQFILLTMFFMFHCNRSGWVMTTARDNLASLLGDDEEGNKCLTIFTVLSVSSLVGLPFIDNILCHAVHLSPSF